MKGVCLPMTLGNNGYFESCKDLQKQVKSNIINLLLTMKGERLHQPDFGCDIHRYVFERMNDDTTEKCKAAITNAIRRWLPYVDIAQIRLTNSDQDTDNNMLRFFVQYRIIPNNIIDSFLLEVDPAKRKLDYYDSQIGETLSATSWERLEPAPVDTLQVWKENPAWDLLPDGRIPRPEIDSRQSRRTRPNIYQ